MFKTNPELDKILAKVEEELKEALFELEKIKVKYTKASAKRLRRHLDKLAKLKVNLRKEMLEYEKHL
ncbi:hypothetical protein [Caminibacter sp.]